jgi:Tol biopolymer transport system component
MSSVRPLRVFLCHASADKYAVRQLYFYLVEFEIDAWLDTEKLSPGQDWEKEIPKAIKNSDAIIICLSKDSVNKEGYVQREIKFALDKADEMPDGRIFLIPVRLDDYDILPDLPKDLKRIQHVNLFEGDGCIKLLESLQIRIQQVGASPIANPTGRSMREKAKQLATIIVHETNIKKIRVTQNKPEKEEFAPGQKTTPWNIGVSLFAFFILILLTLFRDSLFTPAPTPYEEGTPVSIFTSVLTASTSPTVNLILNEMSTATGIATISYTPLPNQEPSVTLTTVPPTIQPTTPPIIPTTTMLPTPTIAPTPTYTPTRQVTDGGKIVFDSPVNGKWQVFSINPDGSDLRQLTNVLTGNGIGDPAISPDGRLIVFIGDDGKALYIIRADGTQTQSIYQTAIEVGYPSWSFDSQKIVFSVKANGYKNLYMMNADGNGVTRLTDSSADDVAPVFSPDGSQIVFSSTRSGRGEIYKLFISSGQIIKLTNLGDPEQIWPSWSPDGLMIAFESRGNLDKRDIFTMYADGTQVKNITDSPKYEGAPVWSPDGAKISFASDRDGGLDIYIMQSNGEQIQRLTTIWAWGPSWSFTK